MTPEERANHVYLGDGVYLEHTPEHIILRTGDHRDNHCDNKIYLEDEVLQSLVNAISDCKKIYPSIIRKISDKKMQHFFDELGKKSDQIILDALKGVVND